MRFRNKPLKFLDGLLLYLFHQSIVPQFVIVVQQYIHKLMSIVLSHSWWVGFINATCGAAIDEHLILIKFSFDIYTRTLKSDEL